MNLRFNEDRISWIRKNLKCPMNEFLAAITDAASPSVISTCAV